MKIKWPENPKIGDYFEHLDYVFGTSDIICYRYTLSGWKYVGIR